MALWNDTRDWHQRVTPETLKKSFRLHLRDTVKGEVTLFLVIRGEQQRKKLCFLVVGRLIALTFVKGTNFDSVCVCVCVGEWYYGCSAEIKCKGALRAPERVQARQKCASLMCFVSPPLPYPNVQLQTKLDNYIRLRLLLWTLVSWPDISSLNFAQFAQFDQDLGTKEVHTSCCRELNKVNFSTNLGRV